MTLDPAGPPEQTPGAAVRTDPSRAAEPTGSWRELLGPEHLAASLVLAGGVAVYAMSAFVTAALLPSVIADIGGSAYFAWVTTSYMVASVLTSTLVARTAALLGPSRAYLLAFLLFAAGSVGAALAPSMAALLGGRVIQGMGGGLLAGLGYAVIRDALPTHLWTRATGLVSAMWGVSTLIGPVLGGAFAQLQIWRGAFWLLALVALALGLTSLRSLPGRGDRTRSVGPLPVPSLITIVLAATAFSIAAVAPAGGPMLLWLLAGALLLGGFVVVERAAPSSVLPRMTYRRGNPLKWLYILLGILSATAMVEIFLPRFGQELAGMTPLLAGIFGATVSIGWSFSQIFSVGAERERSRRILMILGPVLVTGGLLVFTATQHAAPAGWAIGLWVVGLVLAGTGVGLAFPHLSVAAMRSSDDPVEGAKAAAGVNTAELIATTIASALVGLLVAVGGSALMGAGIAALGAVGIGVVALALRGGPRR